MTGTSFVSRLNKKASHNPEVVWKEGTDHPVFSWDVRNLPGTLSVTATASDAARATVSLTSGADGNLSWVLIEKGETGPADVTELEQMAVHQEGTASGNFDITAEGIVTFLVEELKADMEYTVFAAVKPESWCRIPRRPYEAVLRYPGSR